MMTFEFSKVPPLSFGINNRTRLPKQAETMVHSMRFLNSGNDFFTGNAVLMKKYCPNIFRLPGAAIWLDQTVL